jgi:hypothetical protein
MAFPGDGRRFAWPVVSPAQADLAEIVLRSEPETEAPLTEQMAVHT